MFLTKEIEIANKTSRTNGAIGAKAITPRFVEETATSEDTILDFGAGKDAAHTLRLREAGLNVTAYEFGNNVNPDLHDAAALEYKYDVVYASNVINVQSSEQMLHVTLSQIANACKEGGRAVMNFPANPRKGFMDKIVAGYLREVLMGYFSSVERVGGTASAPLYECIK